MEEENVSEQSQSSVQDAQVELFVNEAHEHLARVGRQIRDLADSNRSLLETADTEYTFGGQMGIRSVLFITRVEGYAVVLKQTKLNFSGTAWGPAVSLGEYVGGGTFGYLPPDVIVGHCTFEVHAVGLGPGMLQVNWIRGSQTLGTFLGTGPSIGLTLPSGGSGTWSMA
jgi:hypothetical protein